MRHIFLVVPVGGWMETWQEIGKGAGRRHLLCLTCHNKRCLCLLFDIWSAFFSGVDVASVNSSTIFGSIAH